MKSSNSISQNLILSVVASLTLGLAPFTPEPHIIGKLKWILGGGHDMKMMDYADLLMHGLPWIFLIYYTSQFLRSKIINKTNTKNNEYRQAIKK